MRSSLSNDYQKNNDLTGFLQPVKSQGDSGEFNTQKTSQVEENLTGRMEQTPPKNDLTGFLQPAKS